METSNDRKFDQKLNSSQISMVITSEHMKNISFNTQSLKFMGGPMYNDSKTNIVHEQK